jgi:hypothetical protein
MYSCSPVGRLSPWFVVNERRESGRNREVKHKQGINDVTTPGMASVLEVSTVNVNSDATTARNIRK